MNMRFRLRSAASAVLLLSTLSLWPALAGAQTIPDDRAALEGLKEVKVAFDVTTGDAKRLLGTLNVIDETRQSLIKQGVTPHIVLAFRGPATLLVQSDQTKIKREERETAARIAAKLKELRGAPGVEGMEQCNIAARQLAVNKADVLPEVTVVGNGWISLMAYQAKGYAYIAP
jgi:intracellular sulfur oxidation DsrE/DsrF family protein